jgi:hypothetical protein
MELGLLFTCRLGNVDLDRPVGARQAVVCPQQRRDMAQTPP